MMVSNYVDHAVLEGEVAWLLEKGPKPYWRGRIQKIKYEYAQ